MLQAGGIQSFTVPLPLEEGELLGNPQIAWQAYGKPSDGKAVVVLHDLSHSHEALGTGPDAPYQPFGWGRELIGPGKALDPETTPVLVPNLLGSPFGSTSPLSVEPTSGRAWGVSLPPLTVLDMARGVSALLKALELNQVRALVGVGLGGVVALRLAALFPELTSSVVVIGAARALPEGLREKLGLTSQVLRMAPDNEDTPPLRERVPNRTLSRLRLDYLKLIYGREHLNATYPDNATAQAALEAEAASFADTFDPLSWSLLCSAYAGCDLTDTFAQIRARVLLLTGTTDVLAPAGRVRDTYHLLTASGVQARFVELQGPGDHGTLLSDAHRLRGPVQDFLRWR
ncbi:alpha/beta fold hydrolase [Corallococcus sp. CA053C]|uniref:alpha/beta fold hydrolase n=1 Tax=Corallococcus sp. CA053C TaxID=2316732 RepID=UPI000EA2DD4C|nr:alpha/beta fold hydrolase [Corallococcus sp. CA053C]RKG92426.1 alpha/beta fold hydrolase [Corallococcus sp. CA053C]